MLTLLLLLALLLQVTALTIDYCVVSSETYNCRCFHDCLVLQYCSGLSVLMRERSS
jgi:hypothetical protein